jgi:DNA invertase Pin-like site-specific DNA recombinase
MSHTNGKGGAGNGKALRFAALVRVSTEKQEDPEKSLATQKKAITEDVKRLGGLVVRWYGGQEHATPGWEKKEVDRLIADAGRGLFDAVIVKDADRWSRDNLKSKEGLEAFRQAGIRFFVGPSEKNLYNPEDKFILGIYAEVGELIANQQAKKSMEVRIDRARDRNYLTTGKPVFGRTYDKASGTFSVIEAKRAMVEEVARRYLAGERLVLLAKEVGLSVQHLTRVLRNRCGPTYTLHFNSARLNIHETVDLAVPPLLADATIRAVHRKMTQNRTSPRRQAKYDYLLAGHVYCAGCGYALTGQAITNQQGRVYTWYRHCRGARATQRRPCPLEVKPTVRADHLDAAVLGDLFAMFGNPAAIERATKAAIPDHGKLIKWRAKLEAELKANATRIDRLVEAVAEGDLSREQVKQKMAVLNARADELKAELAKVAGELAELPGEVGGFDVLREGESILVLPHDREEPGEFLQGGNDIGTLLAMSYQDKKALVASIFGTPFPDGSNAGVYVGPSAEPGARFSYELKGRLAWRVTPNPLYWHRFPPT